MKNFLAMIRKFFLRSRCGDAASDSFLVFLLEGEDQGEGGPCADFPLTLALSRKRERETIFAGEDFFEVQC
jgi:hypothetical protein